jgi:hypothetical protein
LINDDSFVEPTFWTIVPLSRMTIWHEGPLSAFTGGAGSIPIPEFWA